MSGPRNPYPGQLGIIEVGALADLLLVDGAITNLDLVADPHKNFLVIMKGGQIFIQERSRVGQQVAAPTRWSDDVGFWPRLSENPVFN
jgi:cytosine/adenosine deaminase-related metal-dependent hydrolase